MLGGADTRRLFLIAAEWRGAANGGDPSGLLLGLEQFDRIAGGVVENDLRAARTGDDVVAELESGVTEALDFSGEILHLNMNTVPAAGYRFATIAHGPASGASLSAEQKTHAVTG